MHGSSLTQLSAYDYHLPDELIAKYPLEKREEARLLIVDRATGSLTDTTVSQLPNYFKTHDQLVFNDTKVIPARLRGKRSTGGEAEVLLHTPSTDGSWWALTRPARKLTLGQKVHLSPDTFIEILEEGEAGHRRVTFHSPLPTLELLEIYGEVPLPHYLRRGQEDSDRINYQTVYARHPGAVAAPTAGFHFTQPLLDRLDEKNVERIHVTLHVGIGTFQPVSEEDIRNHPMHSERCTLSEEAAQSLNNKKMGAKRYCIGTTSVRTLESMVSPDGLFSKGEADTRLFIYPGYNFRAVDGLLTNFHLPKSTLLMLVSAFAGYELIHKAYAHAIMQKYRFYSYGDAMLVL